MRSMRTLHIRMPVHFSNALKLTEYLSGHEKVESVLYPFHDSYAQSVLANQQMKGDTGLFSIRLKSRSLDNVKDFVNSLQYFKRAVSWGGYESLVFPASLKWDDHDNIPRDRISLIRFHAGLEEASLLLGDLEQALSRIKG